MANKSLNSAKSAKEDEFYTQLVDIEHELRHYKKHFKGKVVLCNCDDPYESNFFKYFAMNFNTLGLKKLITTCYKGSPIVGSQLSLFDDSGNEDYGRAFKLEITEIDDYNKDGAINLCDVEWLIKNKANTLSYLGGNGDFRSKECLDLLDEADIIATNPPFSLFREFVLCLVKHNKKFVIIGNQNAITYKEIFPLLMNNEMWIGYKFGDMAFTVPDYYEPRETRFWIDDKGQKWRSLGNVCFYTNMDISKRHEEISLYKNYSDNDYSRYDNYDAIEVSKVADIPCNYAGIMGVPITFMDKYNPEQFEILGATESEGKGFSNGLWDSSSGVAQPLVNGERKYKRIFIRNKHPEVEQ